MVLPPGSFLPAFLESRSVAKATFTDYERRTLIFLTWAVQTSVTWTTVGELDQAMVEYMDRLFFLGCSGDVASETLAAVKFFYPEVGRYGVQSLPRAARALAGWAKVAPRAARLPVPWALAAA